MTTAYPVQPAPTPSRSNGMGVAGFIISLIGLFVGCLAPLGLLFSFIGIFRRPRGLATAGLILGLIGTAVWGVVAAFFGGLVFVCISLGVPGVQTVTAIAQAEQKIIAYENAHGGMEPDEVEGALLIAGEKDGWGTPLRYRRTVGGHEITSAGPDRRFDTSDDFKPDSSRRP